MNWGTKIVLGMVAFMLFIIAMVVYMFSVHGNDALVDKDYYEKGINYNEEYNAKHNVVEEGAQPVITIGKTELSIKLKDSAAYELKLQRPSTVNDDILIKGNTAGSSNLIQLNSTTMPKGLWFLELKWKSNNKEYLFKKDITL
ncbi:FixH family protein [Pedobacter boryungensis]|uniref:FixH family protein n=1 Tax=Pedobacter boryungensis TaxID=869962 RepID=A0ABX2DC06_9SPHI|nr:FixH family protein [Pedobacter boryungensis]NQX31595.1 FixH family protein [Pedobacter boryungensis]